MGLHADAHDASTPRGNVAVEADALGARALQFAPMRRGLVAANLRMHAAECAAVAEHAREADSTFNADQSRQILDDLRASIHAEIEGI